MKPGKFYWKGLGSTALMETDESDRNPVQYIFFNGSRIARLDPGVTTAKYYVADNLGSTALVTDSMGNVLNESLFFPYGGERIIQNSDTGNNYKFTGKERDPETGLDDFGARYYASNIGRFMTPDWDAKPITVPYASFGDPQTLNLYSYVENGPMNKVDADGHWAAPISSGISFQLYFQTPGCSLGGGDGLCVEKEMKIMEGRDYVTDADLINAFAQEFENRYRSENACRMCDGPEKKGKPKKKSDTPDPVEGPLSAPKLLGHYLGGSGTDYHVTEKSFNEFMYEMGKKGKLPINGIPVPGMDGLFQASLGTYGTKYEDAVGMAILYYNKAGKAVGYSDYWNFEPRPGSRSKIGEILVDTATHLPGKAFFVLYGTTPDPSKIAKN